MLILDRYEGNFGVVETDAGYVNYPRGRFAEDVREGDVLRDCGGVFVRDAAATDSRRARIAAKLRRVVR